MSKGRNGGTGGAKGARRATGAAPVPVGRGKGQCSARQRGETNRTGLKRARTVATSPGDR